jgi:uncharacterized protein YbjT (DUF2867 family)
MKIVVVGGTGLIGARTVALLQLRGHHVVAAARATGVNAYTGEGLESALRGAQTVVDVSNSSYTDQAAALEYFYASTLNLLTFGAQLGVTHHIALSVVNTDRLARAQGGYFLAKEQQEKLILAARRPYTLVHSTQFFEFVRSITASAMRDGAAHVADTLIQPIAADDVAAALADTAEGAPENRMIEIAGPETFELRDIAEREMRGRRDERQVVADPLGTYFGARLRRSDLLPSSGARIAPTRFTAWQRQAVAF